MKPEPFSPSRRRCLGGLLGASLGASALPPMLSAQQRDRFEYDPTPEKKPAASSGSSGGGSRGGTSGSSSSSSSSGSSGVTRSSSATLAVGDVIEAYRSQGSPETALYLPATRPSVAQVVIEKKFLGAPVYFLKGISRGTVRGAIVQRSWLDKSGFAPKSDADLARIQQALRTSPFVVTVK